MDKRETRRLAFRQLVDAYDGGVIARAAKRIGKDSSYTARMLYPREKAGSKAIGADTADLITDAYGKPRGFLDGMSATGGYSENDVKALRIAMTALIRALADSIPPVTSAFSENVGKLGEADNFDTSKGLLGRLQDIVASVQNALATAHPPPSRPATDSRTKR